MRKARKSNCPICKSINVTPIVYGYPSPETFEKAERGIDELGGCCIEPDDPHWFCKDCENRW